MAKRKKDDEYHTFQNEWTEEYWEADFCFTNVKCVCLLCGTSLAVFKKCNVERRFTKLHSNFSQDFPLGSSLCKNKVKELKNTLQKQLFTKPKKKVNATTEASFKVAHILTKNKNTFTDGGIIKEHSKQNCLFTFSKWKSKDFSTSPLLQRCWRSIQKQEMCLTNRDIVTC
uniref:SPIN-DOC-like zinc-finger domain-containing protein n=1 Tax=Gouania willdenowi TaxID=441366 RepID=A0A8C5I3V4_GOUWI